MNTNIRFLIASILVAVGPGGIYIIRERITPAQTRPLKQELREMPAQLGLWTGEQAGVDPEVFRVSRYDSSVDREYKNPEGDLVLLHVASRRKIDLRFMHHPTICYPAAGYEIVDEESFQPQVLDHPSLPDRLLTVERDGQRAYVLYWYQMGGRVFFKSDGRRRAIWDLRFSKSWPPQIKVMLQTSAADADEARARLESIAVPLFEWTKQL